MQTPQQPFFSNDLEGLLRVFLMVAGSVATTVAILWKMATGPIFTKLAASEEARKTNIPRIDILERDMLLVKADIRGLDESFGELKNELESVKFDQKQILSKLSDLKTDVGILLDRGARAPNRTRLTDPKEG